MRQLFIDSRDRISGSPQSFSIQLRETLTLTQANSFRIDSIRIPLVIPRIQTGVNDRIFFTMQNGAGGVKFVTLVQGTYSGVDMASMIRQRFHLEHPENPTDPESTDNFWTASYSYTTAGMSIGCLADATFTLLTDAQLVAKGVSPAQSFCSTLFKDANGTVPTSSTATPGQIGGGIQWNFPFVSMVPCDLVYIASSKLSCNDTFGPQGSCDTLAALVTNTDFASVLSQSMPTGVWLPCPSMSTQQLDFQVRDRSYNLLTSLPNWSMVVTIQ